MAMDELDCHRAFAGGGGASLGRARADVTGHEHAWTVGLEQVLGVCRCTREDEAVLRRNFEELLRRTDGVAGKGPIELGTGADAELEEHLAQVVLDRTRADE